MHLKASPTAGRDSLIDPAQARLAPTRQPALDLDKIVKEPLSNISNCEFSMALDLQRIRPAWLCNEAAEGSLSASEKAAMIAAATRKVEELFDVLRIDY